MIVDLSHTLDSDIPMFPGFPALEISDFVSREQSRETYAPETEFLIQRVTMIGNTGTYMDAPYHRYADGRDLANLDLDRLCNLPGMVVDVSARVDEGDMTIVAADVPVDIQGYAVLFRTGWDRHWKSDRYLADNPHLSGEAAEALRCRGAIMVGIDSWNVDDVSDMRRPAHSILLEANIPVIENLTALDRLPQSGFSFFAPPMPLDGGTAIPVRAFAIVLS